MAKWKQLNSTGISIGGEWYPADEKGVVRVPDNVGGLQEYGFTPVAETAAERAQAAEEAAKAAQELADKAAEDAKKAAEEAAKAGKGSK